MSDEITNDEILRSISKLEAKIDKIEGKIEKFKFWAFAIVISVFTALSIDKFLF